MHIGCVSLAGALLLVGTVCAGCSSTGRGAAAAAPTVEDKPRAHALQHEYVASPQAHFDQMAEESREQEAAAKATADAKASKAGRSKGKAAASAPAADFPAPNATPAPTGFPVPSTAPAAPEPAPAPAPEPLAAVPCVPDPCIGGDPCVERPSNQPWCQPRPDVALGGTPSASR